MILGIDHIVILVSDLYQATRDFTESGFTVVPGGEHTGGLSHNALVAFEDGSYLELVAFRGPVPKEHLFYREGVTEGLITYALLPGDIEADITAARERGLEYAGPRSGGRLRPDGVRIEWQLGTPPSQDLPFLCGDVTPRELRVPGDDALNHKNGATGIDNIAIGVKNLAESMRKYAALLGAEPVLSTQRGSESQTRDVVVFDLNGTSIALTQAEMKLHEGPIALALTSRLPVENPHFDPALMRSTQISITDEGRRTKDESS